MEGEKELLQKQKRFIRNFAIQSAMLLILAGVAVIVFSLSQAGGQPESGRDESGIPVYRHGAQL